MLKQWILGITCAALIGALGSALAPAGRVKKAGRLAAGLLLLLAAVKPLGGVDYDALAGALSEYRPDGAAYEAALEEKSGAVLKAVIEERTNAYISDKAKTLGMDCTAEVTYYYGPDGEVRPEAVVVRGEFTDNQQGELSRALEGELGIPAQKQSFERTEDK